MARDREVPPPLEMMCLNALWMAGEGNVEEIRKILSQDRPLAYTTVLTLLDRLARRGAVSRRKEGRGFRYQPLVERNKLRRMALRTFLDFHFEGSEAKLRIFLDEESVAPSPRQIPVPTEDVITESAVAAVYGDAAQDNRQSMAAIAGSGITVLPRE